MITVVFFASLADRAEAESITLELGKIAVVRDLLSALAQTEAKAVIPYLQCETAMVSRNKQFATWETAVEDGDEIGFLPPVSGG